MSGNFVRNILSAATLALTLGTGAPALAQGAEEPLKVGFVYVSPIGEAGWSWQQEVGRRELVEALGDKVVTQYVEDVPEGADAERVIRDLAQQGNKLIFTTSFGYMNPTLKVARQFPDVTFIHSTGYKTADNVGVTNSRFYEARYLAGIVAGKMTESNIIGYVGAFPIPEVLQGINAFTRGIRSVNPEAEVRVIWANSRARNAMPLLRCWVRVPTSSPTIPIPPRRCRPPKNAASMRWPITPT